MLTKAIPALFALLAALPTHGFFILSQEILVSTRLDPIVNPGVVSSHVHSVAGGSAFDKTMTYESARNSKCTTAPVSVDLSNYWIPQLYYYNPADKSFELISVDYVNTYYLPRGNGKISAFPDGLRMVAGNPNRRSFGGTVQDQAISYVCLDYYHDHKGDKEWDQRNNFFNHNCPQGMRAQVNFPSCWDGKNLDSADHKSHMAYASGGPEGGGDCPSTHPVHLVTLFYEYIYDVQKYPFNTGSDPTWVYANGDTTGYGLHGDFLNGWPSLVDGTNILQEAIEQCNANNGVAGDLKACPPFVPFLNYDAGSACKPENPQVNEDIGIGHSIPMLPGNNPIWIGNGTKPTNPTYVEGITTFSDFKSIIPAGYNLTGCIAESTNGRALQGASFANDTMTRGVCVSWCKERGFALAGMEFGRECYCGAATTTINLISSDKCNVACAGNGNELCGGPNALTIFSASDKSLLPAVTLLAPALPTAIVPTNSTVPTAVLPTVPTPILAIIPTVTTALTAVTTTVSTALPSTETDISDSVMPSGYSLTGCIAESPNGRALQGASLTSSNMTRGVCVSWCKDRGFALAGVEYGKECYCGSRMTGASNTTLLPDTKCDMPCANNENETCGGPDTLILFNNPDMYPSVKLPKGWSENGCITDDTSVRALSGYRFRSHTMTPTKCIMVCQAKGFRLAGAEYSSECYCGNSITDNFVQAPAGECNMACSGDKDQLCGGPKRLTTWSFSNTHFARRRFSSRSHF